MPESKDKTALRLPNRNPNPISSDVFLPKFVDIVLFVLFVALLTLIYSPVMLHPPYMPKVGDIAIRDVKADRDLLIEDRETTRLRRRQAAQAVAPVYDWDPGMVEPIIRQLVGALKWLESTRTAARVARVAAAPPAAGDTPAKGNILEEKKPSRERFSQMLEEEMPADAYEAILALESFDLLKERIRRWLYSLRQQPVVNGPKVLETLEELPHYIVHSIIEDTGRQASGNAGLIDLNGMHRLLGASIPRWLEDFPLSIRQWLLEEVRSQVRPNLVLSLAKTKKARNKAFNAVEPVFFQSRRGQMVVREGAVVTEAALMKIKVMHQNNWTSVMMLRVLGLATAMGLFLLLSRWFLTITSVAFPRDRKTTYMLVTILLVTSLLSAITFALGRGLVELLDWPERMVTYLPHVALGSALASLTVGARAGIPGGSLTMGVILSFLASLVTQGGLPLFIYFMIGSLVGGASLRTCRRRFDVLRCGLRVGLIQVVAMPIVELMAGYAPTWDWVLGGTMALASGILTGLWGLALIPLLESLFNITTDSRLMELASGDNPLIRELSLRSPGTYHHSVMMGNLAEAAAENIDANPLLARVMALYHDIGKMKKPHYFVENQSGENRHDHLLPSMSTKIILAHVKDGLEMARQHNLGAPICEAIATHHGTSLLQYFHNRAINQAAKRGEQISEEEFRYPGPTPRSREAGILMLADSVEAAARTLSSPSPTQIQSLVSRIVAGKIRDAQLDECRLTLREIARIEEAFTRVLTLGFYHRRIKYPDQMQKQKKGHRINGRSPGANRPLTVARS